MQKTLKIPNDLGSTLLFTYVMYMLYKTGLVMGRAVSGHLGLVSSLLALSRNLGMMFGTVAGGALLTGADFVLCLALVLCSLLLLLVTVRQARHRHRREETVSS